MMDDTRLCYCIKMLTTCSPTTHRVSTYDNCDIYEFDYSVCVEQSIFEGINVIPYTEINSYRSFKLLDNHNLANCISDTSNNEEFIGNTLI